MIKRLNPVEKGAALLAAVLVLCGIYAALFPTELQVAHLGTSVYEKLIGEDAPSEHVTRKKARMYGIMSVAFGIGIGWLAFYRPLKK